MRKFIQILAIAIGLSLQLDANAHDDCGVRVDKELMQMLLAEGFTFRAKGDKVVIDFHGNGGLVCTTDAYGIDCKPIRQPAPTLI